MHLYRHERTGLAGRRSDLPNRHLVWFVSAISAAVVYCGWYLLRFGKSGGCTGCDARNAPSSVCTRKKDTSEEEGPVLGADHLQQRLLALHPWRKARTLGPVVSTGYVLASLRENVPDAVGAMCEAGLEHARYLAHCPAYL